MTTTEQQAYIDKIAAPIIKYAKQYGYHVVSPIIAQAIEESGWGKSSLAYKYNNHFGMKCGTAWTGPGVNLATMEEYTPGTMTKINDNFRVYPTLDEGVRGYFELLNLSRYANLKPITDPYKYLQTIKDDGYTNKVSYVPDLTSIIKTHDLTRYDKQLTQGGTTMGRKDKLIERMLYWCNDANLGYDQSQRWDIWPGGECDCSSLVYWCLGEAGYWEKPANPAAHTLYTGTLQRDLLAMGFTKLPPSGYPQPGDVVLNDSHHVAVCTGPNGQLSMASIDERGKASGGQAGDQTGQETKTRSYYNYPWNNFYRPPADGASGSVSTTPAAPQPSAPTTPTSSIREVQQWLNDTYKVGMSVDNVYGPNTKRGLVFGLQMELNKQLGKGLSVDGVWGPKTKAACTVVKRGFKGSFVRILQGALICRGYNTGGFDGDFGDATYTAVRSFQASNGLTVDGEAGPNTFAALLG